MDDAYMQKRAFERMLMSGGEFDDLPPRSMLLEELDDGFRGEIPCPYCYEEAYDVPSLCEHLEDEHCYETQGAACPLCAQHNVRDMVGHLASHHMGHTAYKEKGRVGGAPGAGRGRLPPLSVHGGKGLGRGMMEMDAACCEDDYLQIMGHKNPAYCGAGAGEKQGGGGLGAPDPGECSSSSGGGGGASTSKAAWPGSAASATVDPMLPPAQGKAGVREGRAGGQPARDAGLRGLFVQELLLSTIKLDGMSLGP